MPGTNIAALAFDLKSGPLTGNAAEPDERQSLLNLMSGAIDSYKELQSRSHGILDTSEASEMITIASLLLSYPGQHQSIHHHHLWQEK